MNDFTHLRVASAYSMKYGAAQPSELVAAAAELGMSSLALTDRDGLYGAIRFTKACLRHGLQPIIGVDLAVDFSPGHRLTKIGKAPTAAKGGNSDELWRAQHSGQDSCLGLPRVVVLARPGGGWGALCQLVSAVQLAGQRGEPIASIDQIARFTAGGKLVVLLGADSEFGMAVADRREDLALIELARWRTLLDPGQLFVACCDHGVVEHSGSGWSPTSTAHAAGMLRLADQQGVPAVLTNQVRMANPSQAELCDVLDATRRLLPLGRRSLDRRNGAAWLKSAAQMGRVADAIAQRVGGPDAHGRAIKLLDDTAQLASSCVLDPAADVGLGQLHLPEASRFGASQGELSALLRARCEGAVNARYGRAEQAVLGRLDEELAVICELGFEAYFLTVAEVVEMIRDMGIRCAARGSGAGSLVNYLLGISGVEPLSHGLIMERFLSPLRQALPDIDLDVESARRTEIYTQILANFGAERVACMAMIDTYRVRHAVRDVGAALSLPPAEIDAIAKAFPHIRARDARAALRDLPELRNLGLAEPRFEQFFQLVEALDGLPRHVSLHPCGVLLSDATLGQRTPLEASLAGFPMSQFDKDDVEDLGLLKLDILGIRMQSAMAHCLTEIDRTEGQAEVPDIDQLAPFDDQPTYAMIQHAQTLGCFQIESPGQRELVGKFGPQTFEDLIIDISMFRPGPINTDMVVPFLNARQGWTRPRYLHPDFEPILAETEGIVVFHEQVIKLIAAVTGCSLARADEARRALGDWDGQQETKQWLVPQALARGYSAKLVERVWEVLAGFASFGFCKAHAAAFALPTYQSAWLKRHWPAHFLAGILTHDPGMYPKRLLLEEARRMGIAILGMDVNRCGAEYRVERITPPAPVEPLASGLPDGSQWGIRMALSEVKGIAENDIKRIAAGQPYFSLTDFWTRAAVPAPSVENLIRVGAFDAMYGIAVGQFVGQKNNQVTRRDLLLTVQDLLRRDRVDNKTARRARGLHRSPELFHASSENASQAAIRQAGRRAIATKLASSAPGMQMAFDFDAPAESEEVGGWDGSEFANFETASDGLADLDPGELDDKDLDPADIGPAASSTSADRVFRAPNDVRISGLPEMALAERLEAELDVLGMDVSAHVIDFYREFLTALGAVDAAELINLRNSSEVFVAGVKVATQTPAVRSGRRVVFLTLDDGTGPSDATFFEDVQGPYASTVFGSWLLVVRGEVRRTGPRGISLLATGAWDLGLLFENWRQLLADGCTQRQAAELIKADFAPPAPRRRPTRVPPLDPLEESSQPEQTTAYPSAATRAAQQPAAAASGAESPPSAEMPNRAENDGSAASSPDAPSSRPSEPDTAHGRAAGGMGRRVLLHPTGVRQSPYADVAPVGATAPRKLWHSSPGSSGY